MKVRVLAPQGGANQRHRTMANEVRGSNEFDSIIGRVSSGLHNASIHLDILSENENSENLQESFSK
jgi:hypothetical protein